MRTFVAALRVVRQTFQFARQAREFSLVAVIVLGLLIAAIAVVAQFVAPLAMYPFA